jgi:dTDP-4-amino-4,6-dideoxygalactose transaminase
MSLPRRVLQVVQTLLRAPSRALGLVAQTPASELDGRSQPDYAQALHPLSAAVGLPQVSRASALWALRRRQALHYDELLAGSVRIHALPRTAGDVLLRYPVRVDPQHREELAQKLLELGIEPGRWFDDVVHPKGSLRYGYADGQCPVGESLAQAILNLPLGLHANLSAAQSAGLRALALAPA